MSGAKVYVLLSRAERHVHCEELISTAAYLTLYTGCRVNQCRYNRVGLYLCLWVKASDRIPSFGSLKGAFITIKINVTGKIKLTSSDHSWVFSSSSMKSYAFYDPSISSFVSKILPVFLFHYFLLTYFIFYVFYYVVSLFILQPLPVQCRDKLDSAFHRVRSSVELEPTGSFTIFLRYCLQAPAI